MLAWNGMVNMKMQNTFIVLELRCDDVRRISPKQDDAKRRCFGWWEYSTDPQNLLLLLLLLFLLLTQCTRGTHKRIDKEILYSHRIKIYSSSSSLRFFSFSLSCRILRALFFMKRHVSICCEYNQRDEISILNQ